MKEYNWRKEREKFRKDSHQDSPASPAAGEAACAAPPNQSGRSFSRLYILIAAILLVSVASGGFLLYKKTDSTVRLAAAAEKYKKAVGLVVLTIVNKEEINVSIPLGTAWAFHKEKFATNGHVAEGLKTALQMLLENEKKAYLRKKAREEGCKTTEEFLKKLGDKSDAAIRDAEKMAADRIRYIRPEIIINGTQRKNFLISHIQIHKEYGKNGKMFSPDVAVLTIEGRHDTFFKLAEQNTLEDLKSGIPVAFLGFPTELLLGDNVNIENPIASMQSGIIVAMSDFDMKDAGKSSNFLVRHNLPCTGGASGSPIFNAKGEVVAALNAGNTINQITQSGKIDRAPSAAQINFAVRIDLLSGLGEAVKVADFLNFPKKGNVSGNPH